jgi:hypothetical protein
MKETALAMATPRTEGMGAVPGPGRPGHAAGQLILTSALTSSLGSAPSIVAVTSVSVSSTAPPLVDIKSSCTKVHRKLLDDGADDLPDWARGFTVDAAEVDWKAARAIARQYVAAGGKQ